MFCRHLATSQVLHELNINNDMLIVHVSMEVGQFGELTADHSVS